MEVKNKLKSVNRNVKVKVPAMKPVKKMSEKKNGFLIPELVSLEL